MAPNCEGAVTHEKVTKISKVKLKGMGLTVGATVARIHADYVQKSSKHKVKNCHSAFAALERIKESIMRQIKENQSSSRN